MAEKKPKRLRFITRAGLVRLVLVLLLGGGLGGWGCALMIRMPGESYSGPLPELPADDATLRDALRRHVRVLAGEIGERNLLRYDNLQRAADYIEAVLGSPSHPVRRHTFEAQGKECHNLEVEFTGTDRAGEIVLIGGHYDSVFGCPGANDNATGVAALIELARSLGDRKTSRTLRFVAFANEEPPHFQTSSMGSRVYARRCAERGEKIVAMLSLETMGYYSDNKKSQKYPPPFGFFYPSTGNFIAFVGNFSSRQLVKRVVGSFRRHARFPSEGGALPEIVPGAGWSDHWSFWKEGYPGVMVTDTAPFRYPHYHEPGDTPERVDHDRLTRVVRGLERVIEELATE